MRGIRPSARAGPGAARRPAGTARGLAPGWPRHCRHRARARARRRERSCGRQKPRSRPRAPSGPTPGRGRALEVVVGEHVGEVLDPLAGLGLDPAAAAATCLAARCDPRDLAVGDVADEHVPEAELLLAFHRRLRAGRTSSLRASSCSACSTRAGRASPIAATARPEHLPDHRGVLQKRLRVGRSVSSRAAISAWRESGNGTSASASCTCQLEEIAVAQHAHELLRVQGVAARPLERSPAASRRGARPARAGGHERRRLGLGEWREADRGRVPQACAPGVGALVSSGRAVQTISNGTPSAQSARCSRKSSSASSAQCRSSNTSTAGSGSAIDSRNRRQAVNDSSRLAAAPGRRRRAASRRASATPPPRPSGTTSPSFPPRRRASPTRRCRPRALTISPSAQNAIPSPYGRQRPCRQRTSSAASRRRDELGDQAALPHPRLTDDRHELHRRLARAASRTRCGAGDCRARGRRAVVVSAGSRRRRSGPGLRAAATAPPALSSPCLAGWSSPDSKPAPSRRYVWSDRDAVTGAATGCAKPC